MSARLTRPFAAALVLAAFAAGAPRASAEFVFLTYNGTSGNPGISNNRLDAEAGPFYWTQNQLPPNSSFPPPTATFCLELNAGPPVQTLPAPGTTVEFGVFSLSKAPSPAAANANLIAELYGKYYDTAWNSSSFKSSGVTDASISFQIALWELIYDGKSNNLTTGNFFLPDATYTAATNAQKMLNSLTATGDASYFSKKYAGYELVALVAPASSVGGKQTMEVQDQITMRSVGAVPAPAGALLGGIGVVALIGRSRLRRKPVPA
ncbi:hypothetical protein [Urbifossiella limnaea]|uniref:Thioester domain-containing protein n=1 Tax=Urbifossiella limnaea TaxID=2528023 RepID=A0A517Y309_9BACT|nr:hypothetical protein [Urbifossiella limnaea]QDU24098.1 hypothetical protein ETAA1_61110 [Urbifossiella limnaea]